MNGFTSEEAPFLTKSPILDSELPSLVTVLSEGKVRGEGQSRYEFSRQTSDKLIQSDRRWREISDEEAEKAKQACSLYLNTILEATNDRPYPLNPQVFLSIYDSATNVLGLSRLETEELAPHSEAWLEFCIDPQLPFDESIVASQSSR